MKWTLWDRWILKGDLTVQEVIEWFQVHLPLWARERVIMTTIQYSVCMDYTCGLLGHRSVS